MRGNKTSTRTSLLQSLMMPRRDDPGSRPLLSHAETLVSRNDPLLAPLIEAPDEEARQRALETIVLEHVAPTARRVLGRFRAPHSQLTPADVEDVMATVHLRVVGKLRAVLAFEEEAVERLEDYVATLAYNAVYDFLRRRAPARLRLKNRLRYLLINDSRFAMWTLPSGIACGLAEWGGAPRLVANALRAGDWQAVELPANAPSEAVLTLLRHVNGPVLLDDLVAVLAEVWQIGTDAPRHEGVGELADGRRGNPSDDAEARDFLAAVWSEILELPPNQRAALLLNLRDGDGGNAISLLVLLDIAGIDDVAAALGLTAEALAEVWNDLPLDDLTIATMFGLTRQQVINLRKSARARLSRRLSKGSG